MLSFTSSKWLRYRRLREKQKNHSEIFIFSVLVINQKECSKDRLQGNGGLPFANASTKTHVAYYHYHYHFNTVIDKVPSTVPEASMNQERKKC